MIASIPKRELIALDSDDGFIHGTYHRVEWGLSDMEATQEQKRRMGVLIINSLSPTRAGKGDSAVFWADSLAEQGYPVFRIDLPGIGDSYGDPMPDLVNFINRGGFARVISSSITEIVERYSLEGVVVLGLCAGAVSAIYAASVTCMCRGLILLDPKQRRSSHH